jgi:DNA-directed RNA polymerase specialized sigma24 family protein
MQQQDEHQQPCSLDSALYDRYAANIFAYARLHTLSWQDAEDLTLEVFLTALEHDNLSWLSDTQQFVWLRRVAHNKLVDTYRRSSRSAPVPLEQLIETA